MTFKSLISLLFIFFVNFAYATPENFTLDNSHSYVLWSIKHFGYSNQTGKWYANGTLVLDKDDPKNDKVNVTININDFITGISKLDEHLKSKEFFDTAKYPQATFVSTKVVKTGEDTATISGDLTLLGITKPIELKVKLNKAATNAFTNKFTVGFSATTTIKRSDFGMNGFMNALSDEVKLNIEVEASR